MNGIMRFTAVTGRRRWCPRGPPLSEFAELVSARRLYSLEHEAS
jgi:hypothetical protein